MLSKPDIKPEEVLEFVARARAMKQQMQQQGQPEPVLPMPKGEKFIGLYDTATDEMLDGMEKLALWQLGRISTQDAKPFLDRMLGFPPDLPPRKAQRILQRMAKRRKTK